MPFECPGSKNLRQPKPEYVKCASCGQEVEIWTDEVKTACLNCKAVVMRQDQTSCLEWCKYAKECVGEAAYNNFLKNKSILMKDSLLKELEAYFGSDAKRVNHARKVMGFAEELLKREKGDWHIVIPAGILHDVGIKVSEAKYGSSAGHYQEKEGPAIAREILAKLDFKKEDIGEICEIIAHHHSPGKVNTTNFKILYDADWLVNLKDEVDLKDKAKVKAVIDKVFLTDSGRALAKNIYLLSPPCMRGGEAL